MKNPVCPVCGSKLKVVFFDVGAEAEFEFENGKAVFTKVSIDPNNCHETSEVICTKNYKHTDDLDTNFIYKIKKIIYKLSNKRLTLTNQ